MKKLLFAAALLMAACSQQPASENEKMVDVTFEVLQDGWTITTQPMDIVDDDGQSNGNARAISRAMDADGKTMTDIWVLDYKDGALQQQVHQQATDADFGSPMLSLAYGSHDVYFLASRGTGGTVDTDAHTLSFTKVSDTFYRHLSLSVSSTTTSQAVNLSRCVSKMRLVVRDAIPATAATFVITPHTWYYGIDYLTGAPAAAATNAPVTVTIPSSSVGKTNEAISLFGFAPTTQYATDVTVACTDSDGNPLGQATLTDVPIHGNHITEFVGTLFAGTTTMALILFANWGDTINGTW